MQQKLCQLAYVSNATKPFNEAGLLDLLEQSRKNNERDRITGFLMHCEGNFFQVVEGIEEAIDDLYQRLLNDTRHHSVTLLVRRQIEDPMFSEWSMAFRSLDFDELQDVPGYSDFLGDYFDLPEIPGVRKVHISYDIHSIILDLRTRFLT